MPRYFFHLRSPAKSLADCQGLTLAGTEVAREEAKRAAQDFRQPSTGRVAPEWEGWSIDVSDERGRSIMTVPFGAEANEDETRLARREQDGPRVVQLAFERAKREFAAVENEAHALLRRAAMLVDRNRYEAKGLFHLTRSMEEGRKMSQEVLARSRQQRASNDWFVADQATG
jgi:uncharacterized protein DUF6894